MKQFLILGLCLNINAYADINQNSVTTNNTQSQLQEYYISALNVDKQNNNINVGLDIFGLHANNMVYTYQKSSNGKYRWMPDGDLSNGNRGKTTSQIWGITSFKNGKGIDVAGVNGGNYYYYDNYFWQWLNNISNLSVSQVVSDNNDNLFYISYTMSTKSVGTLLPLSFIQSITTNPSSKPQNIYTTNTVSPVYPSYLDSGNDGFVYVIGGNEANASSSEIYRINFNNTATPLNWKEQTGGLSPISVDADADGNVFALTYVSNNYQIWEYSNGSWTQMSSEGLTPISTQNGAYYLGEIKVDNANHVYVMNLTNRIIAEFIDELNSWYPLNNQLNSVVWSANNNFDFDSQNNIYYIVSNPASYSGEVGYNCVVKIDHQNRINSIVGNGNTLPNNNCSALKLSK